MEKESLNTGWNDDWSNYPHNNVGAEDDSYMKNKISNYPWNWHAEIEDGSICPNC